MIEGAAPLQAGQKQKRLYLKLEETGQMPKVQKALEGYPGACEVRVCVDGKTYALPPSKCVEPGEQLLLRMNELLGEQNVRLL